MPCNIFDKTEKIHWRSMIGFVRNRADNEIRQSILMADLRNGRAFHFHAEQIRNRSTKLRQLFRMRNKLIAARNRADKYALPPMQRSGIGGGWGVVISPIILCKIFFRRLLRKFHKPRIDREIANARKRDCKPAKSSTFIDNPCGAHIEIMLNKPVGNNDIANIERRRNRACHAGKDNAIDTEPLDERRSRYCRRDFSPSRKYQHRIHAREAPDVIGAARDRFDRFRLETLRDAFNLL
jgi:hypothetical protein